MPVSLDGALNSDLDATPEIEMIMLLLAKVTEKFEPQADNMKQWITKYFHDPSIITLMQDMTIMAMRVLDAIGRMEPVNGITIATQFDIPKGTVSKVTRRLMAQKLITMEALPNNRKEVLFRTTPLGRDLFLAHRAFDDRMELGFVRFLQRYSTDELNFVVRLLQDVADTSFLDLQTAGGGSGGVQGIHNNGQGDCTAAPQER